jgi:sodium/potassium-transporting ATPase subunit alpha
MPVQSPYQLFFVLFCLSLITLGTQEREARRVVRGFQNLLPQECVVIRDGAETTLPAESLVVGDLVRIKSGIKLPADVRLLSCTQLKLESSSITGESEPVDYQSEPVAETVPIFESHNVAFNGSYCVEGDGMGVVIRTGTDTVIGQIAALTTDQKSNESHLEHEIKLFVKFLTILSIIIGLAVFLIGGFTTYLAQILTTDFAKKH